MCTPLTTFIRLSKLNDALSKLEKEYMSCVPYTSVAGSLLYAMVFTRSYLAQAVNVVTRYMGKPGKEHWQTIK